jgi:hypothetical protein
VRESLNVHAVFDSVDRRDREEHFKKSIQEHDAARLAKIENEKASSAREN